ncbi:MAG TPA: HNH endonuclease signature motif containing protein [Tepidisphaeraceae bacterium]
MAIDNRNCFLVNLRDQLRCRACGAKPEARETYHRGFQYHHVRHRSEGGPDVAENLVLLCGACHDDHHRGKILQFDDRPLPIDVPCRRCGEAFDPKTVAMNCGWYACARCGQRTHLFDHFGYRDEKNLSGESAL